MIGIALVFLVIGIICGQMVFTSEMVAFMGQVSTIALSILIFSVGIDIGFNKESFKKIKEYHIKILVVPIGVMVGSIIGGILTGLFFDMPINESGAVAAGFGWYSLSAVILSNMAGSQLGTIAFLSNIFREVMTIVSVPILVKYLNKYTPIAAAGATSMDTTLPIISKFTDEEVAVISVINGVILTGVVPLIVPMVYNLLK